MNPIRPMCECEARPTDLTMSRAYLDDLMKYEYRRAREQAMNDVIDLLESKKAIWFHQTLVAGSATFWKNKVQTTEQLINEIEELKCQTQ